MMDGFFKIIDLDMVGRIEHFVPYLWRNNEWTVDQQHIIMDRLYGYEEGDGLGHTDMLERIMQITEEEALALIS